jgi:hypothetical protein
MQSMNGSSCTLLGFFSVSGNPRYRTSLASAGSVVLTHRMIPPHAWNIATAYHLLFLCY